MTTMPPADDRRLRICVVGSAVCSELAEPLAELCRRAECRFFAEASAARAALEQQGWPWLDAFLLLQARPGELSRADVERLVAAAPLARVVGLVGPWCEGEGRSGRPLPGVVRVPWRAWPTRLLPELGLPGVATGRTPQLPRTASDTERLTAQLAPLAWQGGGLRAIVRTHSRPVFEALAAALELVEVEAAWQRPGAAREGAAHAAVARADLVLVDGWQCAGGDGARANLPIGGPEIPLLAPPRVLLLAFPRPDDRLAARAAGFAAVVAQPGRLTDLIEAIAASRSPLCRGDAS